MKMQAPMTKYIFEFDNETGEACAAHVFQEVGEYQVKVTSTDEFGNTSRSSILVSVVEEDDRPTKRLNVLF